MMRLFSVSAPLVGLFCWQAGAWRNPDSVDSDRIGERLSVAVHAHGTLQASSRQASALPEAVAPNARSQPEAQIIGRGGGASVHASASLASVGGESREAQLVRGGKKGGLVTTAGIADPQFVANVLRLAITASVAALPPLSQDPPDVNASLSAFGRTLWPMVEMLVTTPELLTPAKEQWDLAFATLPVAEVSTIAGSGQAMYQASAASSSESTYQEKMLSGALDLIARARAALEARRANFSGDEVTQQVAKWSAEGDMHALQSVLNRFWAVAANCTRAFEPADQAHLQVVAVFSWSFSRVWSHGMEGHMLMATKAAWSAAHNASRDLLVESARNAASYDLIMSTIDDAVGTLIEKVLGDRVKILISHLCFKKTVERPSQRPTDCSHMLGSEYDGHFSCLPALRIGGGGACLEPCGQKPGLCPEVCGAEGACCQKGRNEDPVECRGTSGYVDNHMTEGSAYDYHQCVRAGSGLAMSADCWAECGGQAGPCGACGAGGSCMHESSRSGNLLEIGGASSSANVWYGMMGGSSDKDVAFTIDHCQISIVNGPWIHVGFKHGHPKYQRRDHTHYKMWFDDETSKWHVFQDGWLTDEVLFTSTARTPTAPAEGWEGLAVTLSDKNTIYEQTGDPKTKPALGGDYSCRRAAPPAVAQAVTNPSAQLFQVDANGTTGHKRSRDEKWFFSGRRRPTGKGAAKCDTSSAFRSQDGDWCYSECPCGLQVDPVMSHMCSQTCESAEGFPTGAGLLCAVNAQALLTGASLTKVVTHLGTATHIAEQLSSEGINEDALQKTVKSFFTVATYASAAHCPEAACG